MSSLAKVTPDEGTVFHFNNTPLSVNLVPSAEDANLLTYNVEPFDGKEITITAFPNAISFSNNLSCLFLLSLNVSRSRLPKLPNPGD